jgi:LysR family transcriptional regulator for metE and metH
MEMNASGRPLEALLQGAIDLALVASEAVSRHVVQTHLFADELVAVVPPDHALAQRTRLSARDFEPERMFLYSEESSDFMNRVMLPAGLRPASIMAVQITDGIVELVKAGLGISVLPRWMVRPSEASGAIITRPIGRSGLVRHWKAAVRREDARSELRDLIDILKVSLPA